jgi:hypothetical protein
MLSAEVSGRVKSIAIQTGPDSHNISHAILVELALSFEDDHR